MERHHKKTLSGIAALFLVLVILGILGVAIAVLVTTLNIQSNQNAAINNNNNAQNTNQLNVQQPKAINSGSKNYQGYTSVVQLLKQGLNTKVNPCDDFYTYTCGNWGDKPMSFYVSDGGNFAAMAEQLKNTAYAASAPLPVQQTVWYFNQCVSARSNWNTLVADGAQVTKALNLMRKGEPGLENQTAFPFPMYDQNTDITSWPTPIGWGFLLGFPMGNWGISTFVSLFSDTNWKDPHSTQGYSFYLDQPETMLPNTYYRKAWDKYKVSLFNSINHTMYRYAATQKKTLDATQLTKDINDMIALDYLLATTLSTDDTTRRQFARSFNPMTIDMLGMQYPAISWHMVVPETLMPVNTPVANYTLSTSSYQYIVMETYRTQQINSLLTAKNQWGISARTMVNYIYYQVLSANSQYLPSQANSIVLPERETRRISRRPGGVITRRPKTERKQAASVSDAEFSCAAETMEVLMYANARVFIDKIYPTNDSRIAIRNNVAKIASSIVVGFRSMIDQLSWMSDSTKRGAYAKIDNLVKNIAYPDWITDDVALTNYHQTLGIVQSDDYFTVAAKASKFNLYQSWQPLISGPANRIAFNGPPGTTNAWYQPELNSITFPAAILRQPFFDPSWPAGMNFGGMGVIAGHELTHGFDDQGVQWDGTGVLNGWMDPTSQVSFKSMAQCVVDEYSSFCPLNQTMYGSAACIDGAQTQGENIADNGGIHSAWRAYKNFIDLNGPDPQLPDSSLQTLTSDQMFFLAFAQVWCQSPPADSAEERQILVDVHSPSKYRVFGTIQNFPAFKDAFNCPVSNYAPEQHCNVWVSDVKTSYGQPVVASDTNVVAPPRVSPNQLSNYNAYQTANNYFSYSMNMTADPCNDFWTYSCGNYKQLVSFHFADAKNLVIMANKLTDPSYASTIQSSTALTKEKQFFDACVAMTTNSTVQNTTLVQKDYLKQKEDMLTSLLGSSFGVVDQTTATTLTSTQLGSALGWLSFSQGIDTIVTPLVDTNWKTPSKGYLMFLDQSTAYMQKSYYQPKAFANIVASYINSTTNVIMQYALEQGVTLDRTKVVSQVTALVYFEQLLAYNYSTPDDVRRQFARSWNPMSSSELNTNYPVVDWTAYIKQAPAVALSVLQSPSNQFIVMETGQFKSLSSTKFSPALIVNYLHMRLILGETQYLPSYSKFFEELPEDDTMVLGKKRRNMPKRPKSVEMDATASVVQTNCADMANALMQFSNGRVFVDYLYPNDQAKMSIRATAGGIIKNIVSSFQGMLDQLDWMDVGTKSHAQLKTTDLVKNIAFPDWITNNTQLDAYYSSLTFAKNANYFDMWNSLVQFNLMLQYQQLTFATYNRHDFLGQPGTVNAWYQPELNSITFPAGILTTPYFDPNWPASLNYGGLGVVAGHELTHGFDDQGVQWDQTGALNSWMSANSSVSFKNMAQCVIDEYSKFCPLDPKQYNPYCVNGAQTQGENIADNGGIHAAFRAYRTHVQLNGPDPQLNDRVLSQFTHDQLFFLSFGQVWCENRRSDANLYKQLMVDPHSPSMYRVFGTIQNYPAFQNAFNCKKGDAYAPVDHCKVWVPNTFA